MAQSTNAQEKNTGTAQETQNCEFETKVGITCVGSLIVYQLFYYYFMILMVYGSHAGF